MPTKLYTHALRKIFATGKIVGAAHITGGGLVENIPRVIPKHLAARINTNAWDIPSIFKWLQEKGRIRETEMLKTFNCGIGFALIVKPESKHNVTQQLNGLGEYPIEIGCLVDRKSSPLIFK